MACCLALGLLASCVSNYDGPMPSGERLPVLNALLYPDSAIALRLTWPQKVGNTSNYAPICNALVLVKENNVPIGYAAPERDGWYLMDAAAKAGHEYSIEAEVPGYKTLTATTYIPSPIDVSMEQHIEQCYPLDLTMVNLDLGKIPTHASGIWVHAKEANPDGTWKKDPMMMYSNSPLPDSFNRSYNSAAECGHSFSYDFFIRVHGDLLNSAHNTLLFAPFVPIKQGAVVVITAGADYDRYFKSLFLQSYWSPKSDVPFTYEPVKVYSNVQNGYGIFAGCAVELKNF